MKLLYEAKSVSENDYEKAVAGLRQLKAQLQLNQNKLDYTKLYAPLSGYIQSVNFEPAEMVDAGTPLVTLLDINRLEVELDIPVEVYQPVPMKLKSLTPKADGTQLYRMCLTFEGKAPQKLTAGMNASITLRMASEGQDGTFTLPMHAVFKENGNTYVWTIVCMDDRQRLAGTQSASRPARHGRKRAGGHLFGTERRRASGKSRSECPARERESKHHTPTG